MEASIGFDFYRGVNRDLSEEDVRMMNALSLAYIGDGVFELIIRTKITDGHKKAHALHVEAAKHVRASAQREYLERVESSLTEREAVVVRRAKNAKSYTVPKNADLMDYKLATAFEALIGYLYLIKNYDRIYELMRICDIWEDLYER